MQSSSAPSSLQAVTLAAAAVSDQEEGESWVGSTEERGGRADKRHKCQTQHTQLTRHHPQGTLLPCDRAVNAPP